VIEDINRKRLQDLEENMEQDLKHLKEYEEELRFETEPRRRGDIRRNIQQQHESVKKNRHEYEELQEIVTPAQIQNISDLLEQITAKLDEIQSYWISMSDRPTTIDLLGFKNFTEPIAKRISDFTDEDTPITIGIFGEWGSGKTSFLKMIVEDLEYKYKIYPIWFDAWKYEKEDNLWSALLQCILDQSIISGKWYRRLWIKLKIWNKSIDLSSGSMSISKKLTPVIIQILLFITAILIVFTWSPQEIENYLQQFNLFQVNGNIIKFIVSAVAVLAAGPDFFLRLFGTHLYIDFSKMSSKETYREHISFLDKFNENFGQIIKFIVDDKPLVVIVDDLDRCLPEKALQVLETIKVFLDVERCVFLIAVDREIVEKVICTKYKDFLDITKIEKKPHDLEKFSENYFEKIVQLPILVPPLDKDIVKDFIEQLYSNIDETNSEDIIDIFTVGLPNNPRKIKHALQIFILWQDLAMKEIKTDKIKLPLLAKIVVIQIQFRAIYNEIIRHPILLHELEFVSLKQEGLLTDDDIINGEQYKKEKAQKYVNEYPELEILLTRGMKQRTRFIDVNIDDYVFLLRKLSYKISITEEKEYKDFVVELEGTIGKDLELLQEYEDELRYEDEPLRKAEIRRNIQRQRKSLKHYQQEYSELRTQVPPEQRMNIINILQKMEEQLDDLQKVLPSIWSVPYSRNPNFTGYEDILAELWATFTSEKPNAWIQAITGMGGVGKTQLVVEYCYRQNAEYQVIWWIRSEELATMASDYANLAELLGLPEKDSFDQTEIVRAVKSWLEHNSGWLLIFDNAQDTNEISDYLPRAGGGHVIITSRNPRWSKIAKVLHAKVFDRTESVNFLCRRTGQDDKKAANMLAEELGDLPLALEQASAYIEETTMSLAAYCELFQSRRQELWGEESPPMGYPQAVGATWSLAMERVGEESPEAAYLLNLCSYLAPDNIPLELILEGREHIPEPLASVVIDKLNMNTVIMSLRQYSLIETSEESLSVHRLLQDVVRDHLAKEDEKLWAETALRLVNKALPSESDDVRNWPIMSELLPHAQAAVNHTEALEIAPKETQYILNQMGLFLYKCAQFAEANIHFNRALAIGEAAYGPEHPQVAISINNLGGVLKDLGDLQGAKKNYERALAIDETAYGPDHPDVAIDVNNLGSVLQALGDLQGAKKNYERALAIDKTAYGPDHPTVAIRVGNLGSVLQALGDLQGAKKNYERALAIDETAYGPDHPDVAIDVNNLGGILQALGDLQGAKKNYERALAIDESAYGPDHPDVAIRVGNLGRVLQDLGDLQGAKKNYVRALAIDESAYGPDHPTVAIDVGNLGGVLKALGDLKSAKKKYERALAINETAYGPDHPNVAIRVSNLGLVLQDLGDLQGAKKNYERALAIGEAVYGPDHPTVATHVGNLGGVLKDLGDLQGAKKNYERALAIFTKFLGEEHPNTVTVRNNIEYLESQLES